MTAAHYYLYMAVSGFFFIASWAFERGSPVRLAVSLVALAFAVIALYISVRAAWKNK